MPKDSVRWIVPSPAADLPRPDGSQETRLAGQRTYRPGPPDKPAHRGAGEAVRAEIPERPRAAVAVTSGTGLRRGEALGLSVDGVDLLRRQLTIDRKPARSRGPLAPSVRSRLGRACKIGALRGGTTTSRTAFSSG